MTTTYPSAPPLYLPQPQSTLSNVIVIQNQPSRNLWEFENEWHNDLCSCFENCGSCCFAYCCWPCFMCSLLDDMREHCCVYFCVPYYLMAMRTKMRTMFRIKGSMMKDCCVVTFCAFCSALQMSNELKHRGVV